MAGKYLRAAFQALPAPARDFRIRRKRVSARWHLWWWHSCFMSSGYRSLFLLEAPWLCVFLFFLGRSLHPSIRRCLWWSSEAQQLLSRSVAPSCFATSKRSLRLLRVQGPLLPYPIRASTWGCVGSTIEGPLRFIRGHVSFRAANPL